MSYNRKYPGVNVERRFQTGPRWSETKHGVLRRLSDFTEPPHFTGGLKGVRQSVSVPEPDFNVEPKGGKGQDERKDQREH